MTQSSVSNVAPARLIESAERRVSNTVSRLAPDFHAACLSLGARLYDIIVNDYDSGIGNRITYNVSDQWQEIDYRVDGVKVPCIYAVPDKQEPLAHITLVTGLKSMSHDIYQALELLRTLGFSFTCVNLTNPGEDIYYMPHFQNIQRNIMVENPPDVPNAPDTPHLLLTHSTGGMLALKEQARLKNTDSLKQRYNGVIHLAPMLGSPHRKTTSSRLLYQAYTGIFGNRHYKETLVDRFHAAHFCLNGHLDYIHHRYRKSMLYRLDKALEAMTGNDNTATHHYPTHAQNLYTISCGEETFKHLMYFGFPKDQNPLPTYFIYGDQDFMSDPQNIETISTIMPGAELCKIPGGGHFLFHNTPDTRRAILNAAVDMLKDDAPALADKIRREATHMPEEMQNRKKAQKSGFPCLQKILPGGKNAPD